MICFETYLDICYIIISKEIKHIYSYLLFDYHTVNFLSVNILILI